MKKRLSFNSPRIYPFDKAQGLRHLLPANRGFTIVELLIVIIIIAILAAVTYVSYGGLQNNATVASLQSDLTNASDQLVIDQANSSTGVFPATLAAASGVIKWSGNTTPTYTVNNTNTPKTFCLSAVKGSQRYFITQEGLPMPGPCPVLYLDAGITTSYPGTGTTWTDLSGNGNNGTLVGGLGVAGLGYSTANGGLLTFDGVDDYLNVGSGTSLQLTNTGTVSLWFKPTVAFNGNTGTQQHFACGAREFYFSSSSSTLYYFLADGATSSNSNSSSWNNNWYNVTATSNGTIVNMYINGVLQTVTGNATGKNFFYSTNPVTISKSSGGFKGSIASVNIYNRALTSTEITQNYNFLKSRYGL